jgi:hypothetical protein
VRTRFCLSALTLAILFGPLPAADLAKIERTILKEPAYQTKAPRYCLLVFGPDAGTRVWLVLDGDTLYVDRNGNGDLTDKNEKVALPQFDKRDEPNGFMLGQRQIQAGTITAGPKDHLELMLLQYKINPAYKPKSNREADMIKLYGSASDGLVTGVMTTSDLKALKKFSGAAADTKEATSESVMQIAGADPSGVMQFAARPQDAPIVHFKGPLQIALQAMQKLERGQQSELQLGIGTPGLGKGTFAMRSYDGVPKDAHPVVDLEYPHRDVGKPPIKLQVTLKERC